ncbi:probable E3 ubiquitin-protein ligase HECTD2 [Homarus americanus]|uniref:probable E3 ubiquitin-protein ligase HECTD2 n=1 Tax=Homarus americanus TaxID=6706 RepID=UPI001C47CF44|nr:probable E3 ubiquitin-protein ligase HECTD2 [Homarus americanus]XP_042209378.1 probable E3 ubiquitin-protein ligase HECTD2 [Homarus americanus]XP_042209379.1 probable E3 ubiquitin-protein ligase HECTD2 [Homarus americanus]XP_042209380.1 probable E3 ubiquitin-protein ligase HECTD2 [Homarus americanus]XP_042209381.1 probable E3 ubiquitin-protein ligase HECTD2 [Homarus americanus]
MATEWEQLREQLLTPNTRRLQRLAVVTDLMESLSESLLQNQGGITCPSCRVTVEAPNGRLRQICPYCGSFYNAGANTDVRLRRNRELRLELPHIDVENRSRFGGLGNFMIGRLGGLNFPGCTNDTLTGGGVNNNNEEGVGEEVVTDGSHTINCGILAPINDATAYRVGSGSSLPPIRRQEVNSRRGSVASSRKGSGSLRSARSEERIPLRETTSSSTSHQRPVYPARTTRREDFMQEVRKAKETKNFTDMKKFYFNTFESYASICATFKRNPDYDGARVDDPGLKMELVYTVHDSVHEMPSVVHKHFLKAVINALLQERPHLFSKDRVRALFVVLQSPVFLTQSSYTVLAHVLRNITSLPNGDHQLLVNWFRTLEVSRLRMMVGFITQFLSVRQFPPPDRSLPPLSKSKWWIPTATKVLAILYASNTSSQTPLLNYTEFYNHALDHLELMTEYKNWQDPTKPDTFSFCQYPFILSIVAKRHILTKDAEYQMIVTAKRSLVDKVARHQPPQIDIFFLNINIRRNHLVEDSLKEIAAKKRDLKKKLKVTFEGEPGLDMGGLTKEWFMLIIKQIFKPENKMFVYHPSKRLYWFSLAQDGNLREYNLIGVLMGLAVYNSIILDVHFPAICYRKLLSPPVVPAYEHLAVGIAKAPGLDDLSEIMPEVAHGLRELLKYEGDVEEDMCLSFQVSLEEFGQPRTFNLKENGESLPVTNENREEFVKLYLDWILNTAIYEQFRAFYLGFHTVCASNALIMLRPEEVELLVCGSPTLDLNELRKVAEYDGYPEDHPTIKWFWEVVNEMPVDQQKLFLLFTTGSDRIPVGGMGEMMFKISCWRAHTHMLPQAHTCFNQLVLPPYSSKTILRNKLYIALANAEGFGLE